MNYLMCGKPLHDVVFFGLFHGAVDQRHIREHAGQFFVDFLGRFHIQHFRFFNQRRHDIGLSSGFDLLAHQIIALFALLY